MLESEAKNVSVPVPPIEKMLMPPERLLFNQGCASSESWIMV